MGILGRTVKTLFDATWTLLEWPAYICGGIILAIMVMSFSFLIYYRVFKGMNPPAGEHHKPKKRNLLLKIFWDAPKQFAIDRLNRNPEFFRHQGLILYVGDQGSGKTSTMVYDIMKSQEEYPKVKCITNFGYNHQNNELRHWKQLVNYKNGIQGVEVAIDEIQNWFNSKQSKNFPPEMLQIVTTNRKNRRCIRGTAQRYYMVSKDIRTQCSEVRECHTLGGVFTIVLRKKYICDSEGEVEKKKLIGMYCWVHNEETRNAYDTYRMIDVLGKDGFKEESEQYRMQTATKQEINIEAKLKK